MLTGFDAYHKWLSIPPHDQPPNHYRLLGLGLFESDPDVIAAAADRQMAHIQTYKNGPHADLSQKLLNEIAAAKICLLRPQKKSGYDQQLRQQMDASAARVGPLGAATVPQLPSQSMMPQSPLPAAGAASPTGTEQLRHPAYPGTSFTPPPPTLPPPVARGRRSLEMESSRPSAGTMIALVAVGALAVLLVIGVFIALTNRANHSLPSVPSSAKPNTSAEIPATNPQRPSPTGPVARTNRPATTPITAQTKKAPVAPATPTSSRPAPIAGNQVATNLSPKPNQGKSPLPPTAPISPVPSQLPPGKAAIPVAAAIAAVKQRLGDLSTAQAADLLDQAHKTTDSAEVYVLLEQALDMAVMRGVAAKAISVADEMERRFAIDSLQFRFQTFEDLRLHVESPASWQALANGAAALIDDATAAGKPALAEQLAELSITAARNSDNLDTIRSITLRILRLRSAPTPVLKSSASP